MSVYKIFPAKDATLYSRYSVQNTGRDPILEISAKNSLDYLRLDGKVTLEDSPYYSYDTAVDEYYDTPIPAEDIRRTILAFSDADLATIKSLNSSSFQANLRMYLAFAQNLSTEYTVECYPLTQSWSMGTGRFADRPYIKNGASWAYTGQYQASPTWSAASGSTAILFTSGGGVWNGSLQATQSFIYTDNKDLNINVTDIVSKWFSGSQNNGVVLKHTTAVEQNTGSFVDLKFFSVDTNTIYPPCLEFKWDDSTYLQSPSNQKIIITNDFVLLAENNIGTYKENSIYTFRLKGKDKYPVRQFTTSSIYLSWKYLPSESYWAIQDYKTKEMVVDFDRQYTRISADYYGNYFNLYMQGLQPERYYKILVKSKIYNTSYGPLSLYDNETAIYDALSTYSPADLNALPYQEVVVDNDIIFKIVR